MIVSLLAVPLVAAAAVAPSPRLVAEAPPAAQAATAPAKLWFRIDSAILGQSRRVVVRLPESFPATPAARRYPTTVVFDGDWLLDPVAAVSDVLVREGQIPESVLVAIENTDDFGGRVFDLTPPGMSVSGSDRRQGGDRFLDFIERELLPALDAELRCGAPRTLVGTSSGGILATYAFATRDTFRFVLALDTPVALDDHALAELVVGRAPGATMPRRYATIEARMGWTDARWAALTKAAPPAWRLHRQSLERESHTSMQFLGAYLGLRELFHDFSMIEATRLPTTSVLPRYDALAADYGAAVTPPAPLLRQLVEDLSMEGRGAAARRAFDWLRSAYGEPRGAAELAAQIAEVERRPPPTETVESLLATPFPSVDAIGDYLGVWEGETWVNPEVRHRFELRLAVENGRVTGEMVSWPGASTELVRPLQYLAVTPDGLAFGDMNGIRPRGLLLHEGRRAGDVLHGEVRFGGIRFFSADGHQPARHFFRLRKRRAS